MKFFLAVAFVLLSTLPCSASDGFGAAKWGYSKIKTEQALNIALEKYKESHSSVVFLYADQIKSKKDCLLYTGKYKIFGNEFTGVFVYTKSDELCQVFMFTSKSDKNSEIHKDYSILTDRFSRAFERYSIKSLPKKSLNLGSSHYELQEWVGKSGRMVLLGERDASAGNYTYILEAVWEGETPEF